MTETRRPALNPPPKPSTPRQAPWDDIGDLLNKMDTLTGQMSQLISLMGGQPPTTIVSPPSISFPEIPEFPGWEPVTSRLDDIKDKLDEIADEITLTAQDTVTLFSQKIQAANTFYSSMANWTKGHRMRLRVVSSLDVAVTVQVIGNISNSVNDADDLQGLLFTCPANDSISIGPDWDDWHPYIGVRLTTAIAPAKGSLYVYSVIQL